VPVIVVGNISVGGTGKTPLVIAIVQYLLSKGYKPGVVSRGYGGESRHWPQIVTQDTSPVDVGDEAVLIAKRCACPVSVGSNRIKAAEKLLQENSCDVIVSDDGLQHLKLKRDVEIVVIDGERRFGNGLCLPAGPMRELSGRLRSVDFVVVNGESTDNEQSMQLMVNEFEDVSGSGQTLSSRDMSGKRAHAVAGIGNNERFFKVLEKLNIDILRHPFPDHYCYQSKDVTFDDDLPILMTEKDAVKCRQFRLNNAWFLKVDAKLENTFLGKLNDALQSRLTDKPNLLKEVD